MPPLPSPSSPPASSPPTQPQGAAPADLPKQYRPAENEGRIRERWESSGVFQADPARVLTGEARPYAILIPPPNVTAALHLGHALNNTIQDILARAHRMMGFETLWMPGTDHAGIATQTVVEKRVLAETGRKRTDFPRDEFVAKIQAFKDEYEATITGQLKAMGCSCDWARQRFTMDEVCARAVREAFFRLFKDGLIYRGKRLVNWDPVTQTALADDEVEMEEVEGFFYYLRYPLVQRSNGTATVREREGHASTGTEPERAHPPSEFIPVLWRDLAARGYPIDESTEQLADDPAWVTVATTRPETYLGDTAVAINPDDPRAKALRGLHVRLPLVSRVIPIIEDDYVVMPAKDPDAQGVDVKAKYATGFLKVTPAHDPNDYDIGRRHNLDAINVMAPDASISDVYGWSNPEDAYIFVGLSREDARKAVLRAFADLKLLEDKKPYRHSIGHSYRSHAAIEPYLSDQWYVRVTDDRLKGSALRAMAPEQRTGGGTSIDDGRATPEGGAGVPPAVWPGLHSTGSVTTQRGSAPAVPPWPAIITKSTTHSYRRLPHFQKGGSAYFITFRLANGFLNEPERQIVLNACRHWHGERLTLHLVTVMPDHVHLLITPLERAPGGGAWWTLRDLLHSIKSFTGHEITKARGTTGQLWQDEYYDRIVRDGDEFVEKWNYMLMNPVREGLAEKPGEYPFSFGPEWNQPNSASQQDGGRDARPTASDRLTFYPARYAKTYETWHENIRDWCISRQLWWGHRIPVWTAIRLAAQLTPLGAAELADEERQIRDWERLGRVVYQVHRREERGMQGTIHAHVAVLDGGDTDTSIVAQLQAWGYRQDPDVLDTWFSSALWPLSTMGWPDPEAAARDTGLEDFPQLLPAFNPTDALCTAREIITLWVSRMVMFNRYFLGTASGNGHSAFGKGHGAASTNAECPIPNAFPSAPIPFRDVFIHAMIQDGEGRKMSKSLGNGVDPLDIIDSHGADAMRFTLCHMTTQTQDVRMPVERDPKTGKNTSPKFDLGRNFCNKLWNAARFSLGILNGAGTDAAGSDPATSPLRHSATSPLPPPLSLPDRWILSRLAAATRDINAALADYQFSAYAQTLYDLLWRDFCDWYLEAIKPTAAIDPQQRAVLANTLQSIIRLLHPIAPFITETLWERLKDIETEPIRGLTLTPSRKAGLLCTAGWPEIDPSLRDEGAEAEFERVRELVTAIREVRAQHQVAPKRKVTLHLPASQSESLGTDALRLVETLAGLGRITTTPPPSTAGTAVAFSLGTAEHHLSDLADAVDASAERARLEKQLADLDKSIKTLEGRLANPGYADKAPPAMVQQTRDGLAKAIAERTAAAAALERLG